MASTSSFWPTIRRRTKPCPNQKTARYDFRGGSVVYEDVVTEWHYQEEFRPGAWAQTDYNFETPSTSLAVTVNGKNPYEIYEYPGEYRVRADGDKSGHASVCRSRRRRAIVSQGASGCRYFSSGYQFTLAGSLSERSEPGVPADAVRHMATQGGRLPGRRERRTKS